jgi:hypothetical protein
MTVRKKLTESQVTVAFIIGGGMTLLILGFLLAGAQSATPNFTVSRLNILMIVGGTLAVTGSIAWLMLTQPWKDFDDWSTPLYTGHDDHAHGAAHDEAKVDNLMTIPGISEKVQKVLNGVGIYTYAQLAAHQPAEIERIVKDAGLRVSKPAKWIDQAKVASSDTIISASNKTQRIQRPGSGHGH